MGIGDDDPLGAFYFPVSIGNGDTSLLACFLFCRVFCYVEIGKYFKRFSLFIKSLYGNHSAGYTYLRSCNPYSIYGAGGYCFYEFVRQNPVCRAQYFRGCEFAGGTPQKSRIDRIGYRIYFQYIFMIGNKVSLIILNSCSVKMICLGVHEKKHRNNAGRRRYKLFFCIIYLLSFYKWIIK